MVTSTPTRTATLIPMTFTDVHPSDYFYEPVRVLYGRGVIERRPYDQRPRYEYVLTGKGRELVDVLMVMVAWGDKWLAGKAGPPVLYRHHACGEISHVDLTCANCGKPMHADDVEVLPGPGAAA